MAKDPGESTEYDVKYQTTEERMLKMLPHVSKKFLCRIAAEELHYRITYDTGITAEEILADFDKDFTRLKSGRLPNAAKHN